MKVGRGLTLNARLTQKFSTSTKCFDVYGSYLEAEKEPTARAGIMNNKFCAVKKENKSSQPVRARGRGVLRRRQMRIIKLQTSHPTNQFVSAKG